MLQYGNARCESVRRTDWPHAATITVPLYDNYRPAIYSLPRVRYPVTSCGAPRDFKVRVADVDLRR